MLLLIMVVLVVGGFTRSLQFTATNTLAFADIEPERMSRGSAPNDSSQRTTQPRRTS